MDLDVTTSTARLLHKRSAPDFDPNVKLPLSKRQRPQFDCPSTLLLEKPEGCTSDCSDRMLLSRIARLTSSPVHPSPWGLHFPSSGWS
jgi:hypothetical protein